MNNMYGLGTYGANSFVDTFFGTSSTRGGSLLSSIGDLQMIQKGAYKNVEGKRILLPAKGHLQDTLTEMEQDLQSAISYAGGRQVADLKHVDYVIVKNSIWNGDASH